MQRTFPLCAASLRIKTFGAMFRLLITMTIAALFGCVRGPSILPQISSTPLPSTSSSLLIATASSHTPTPLAIVDCMIGIKFYAWHDLDHDGLPSQGEPPLAGVRINLDGWATARLMTDDQGGSRYFSLAGCPPPSVIASAESPPGYTPTTPLRTTISRLAVNEPVLFGFAEMRP